MTLKLSMIAAVASNGIIGADNKLIWDIKEDLRWFRAQTLQTTIVMGRKTMQSLGRPLDNRRNIVMSRSNLNTPGFERLSKQEILKLAELESVVIIGGGEIYREFLPYAQTLYITHVDREFEGDTYFPRIDKDEWFRDWKDGPRGKELQYTFARYVRKDAVK